MGIIGEVKDLDNQSIPFANVLLLQPQDSSLVIGAITNIEGDFLLKVQPGNYLIKVTMIGFQPIFSSLIEIGNTREDVHFSTFYLSESVMQLNEVVIRAQKPLFEKQIDRTVINVQSSITSAGSTALEILEKSPGLIVNRQNNSISMNGKSGVLVMINNKVIHLPIDAVLQMLDGMSSSNIKKIELITTPPAKFDAEGDAGIINIVMNESADHGTNGNFGGTVGYNKAETLGGNFSLNHRSMHSTYFINYSINRDRNIHQWNNDRFLKENNFTKTIIGSSARKPTTSAQNLRFGIEHDFNGKITATVLVTGYRRNWDMSALTTNVNSAAPDSTINTEMSILEINRWQSASLGLGFRYRFDRQELNISFDYLYYHNNNPSSYNNRISFLEAAETDNEITQVEKLTPINFKVAHLDYANQVNDKLSMDVGVKSTFSEFTNKVIVKTLIKDVFVIDGEFTNSSILDEKILATYLAWKWQPNPDWMINAGLRYEYTDTNLSTPQDAGLLSRSFGNLFPSLFVSRNLNEYSKLQMAYSRRITRPTFNDMAPYVFFIGPNTFVAGNLSLKPAISDGLDLSYQLKQWWVTLKYSYSQDEIVTYQPEVNTNTNVQIFRSQNLKYMHRYGISTNLPVDVTPWWEIQNDLSFYIFDYQSKWLDSNVRRREKSLTANIINNFKLARDYSVELSGYYQSTSLWGIGHIRPIGKINVGIKKQLKKEQGVITMTISDLLNSGQWKIDMNVPEANIQSTMFYDWGSRSVNLTYSRKFGNKKLNKVEIKSGSEAEQQRVN